MTSQKKMSQRLKKSCSEDKNLLKVAEDERTTMTKLYNYFVYDAHPLTIWYYSHFHQSWHSSVEGVLFKMLDIMEFTPINYYNLCLPTHT